MGPMNDPCVCLSWVTRGLPLMGHTGVCNSLSRGTHAFCLSKGPHGTHMKPMCVCHLYCPCWAHVWLPLWGHTWAATNGVHWSMEQISTWCPFVLPLKGPTWDRILYSINSQFPMDKYGSQDRRDEELFTNLVDISLRNYSITPWQITSLSEADHQYQESRHSNFNWSPPRQNGLHFADDIFRCVFVDEVLYFH